MVGTFLLWYRAVRHARIRVRVVLEISVGLALGSLVVDHANSTEHHDLLRGQIVTFELLDLEVREVVMFVRLIKYQQDQVSAASIPVSVSQPSLLCTADSAFSTYLGRSQC